MPEKSHNKFNLVLLLFSTALNMVNRRDLHIRQLIWAEYRAGRSEKNAYSNLNKKLGLGSISKETIDSFYQRFQSGNSSLFDTDSLQYGIPQAIQTFPNGDEARNFKRLERKCVTILEGLC